MPYPRLIALCLSGALLGACATTQPAPLANACYSDGDALGPCTRIVLGADPLLSQRPAEKPQWPKVLGWSAVAAGLVSSGVGVAHLFIADARRGDVGGATTTREADRLIRESEDAETVAAWSLGVGVPFVVGGVAVLLVDALSGAPDRPADPSTSWYVAPTPSSSGAGAQVGFRVPLF